MKKLEEIRADKRIKWTRDFMPQFQMYQGEFDLGRVKGNVVFGYNEGGWEHVSIAPFSGKTPSWDDMCEIKDIFFYEEEEAIQIHAKKSKYVNLKENCLHIWRNPDVVLPF